MEYTKKLTVKIIDIDADKPIALLNSKTASDLLAVALNRIDVKNNGVSKIFILDITDSLIDENTIGIYKDVTGVTKLKDGDKVEVKVVPSPSSVHHIVKKIRNNALNETEIKEIINDVVNDRLSEIEISAFLTAVSINGLNLDETTNICKSMIEVGNVIKFDVPQVLDKHSIGGINGRVSIVVTPIITALGYVMPKTASRAISSAAGTADCMEVLGDVSFSVKDIEKMVSKVGGIVAWNGKVDLCPADDKMIKIRHSLGLDPEGLVIASVLAKKKSVSATHLIIDIPVGPTVKVRSKEEVDRWASKFLIICKDIGIKAQVVQSDGAVPCGKYFGAALEAKGALEVLENKYFDNFAEKSCVIAGRLLELVERVEPGKGYDLAKETLKSGAALNKFKEILKAQNGRIFSSEEIPVANYKQEILAKDVGKIVGMNVSNLTKIARTAGAPHDKVAGLVLNKKVGDIVKPKELIFTIHANSKEKLKIATELANDTMTDTIKIMKEEVNQ
jgi:AMP phosphorylase